MRQKIQGQLNLLQRPLAKCLIKKGICRVSNLKSILNS
ncbi:hypothetical protein GLYMA_01G120850v4 [Glycine max]|nr:hypothetical protein GLYMA_01G120850v4 [Glycine max]KAH1162748.1 hypothetical protein GYH30_001300 [Glycine max]